MQLLPVLRVKLFSRIFKQQIKGVNQTDISYLFLSQWGKIITPEDDSSSYIKILLQELSDVVTEET